MIDLKGKETRTLQELATLVGAQVEGDEKLAITGANDLQHASSSEISFLANPKYQPYLQHTQAAAVIVRPECDRISGRAYLIHEDPSFAFQQILNFFHSEREKKSYFEGVHPTAVIHPTARVASTAQVGPYAVIDGYTSIGERCVIGAHVSIGPHCAVDEEVLIYPHAVIREGCCIKNRVVIQPGAVIGSCGFGFSTDKNGLHYKQDQWGNVVIEEDVEVGANTTIDRARIQSTSIGSGTKIDNLVQIAHNVQIGKNCLIVSQVGIAGSAKIGDQVVLAGKVGITGHIELARGVVIAGSSSVSKSIKVPGTYLGTPALPIEQFTRMMSRMKHLDELFHRVQVLEKSRKIEEENI